jgi:RNA polymerase sigma-70 factor (ECF subfamily)
VQSIEQQVVEHIPRLRRYARALLRGDVAAADDLVQDCLERALSRLRLWRRDSDLRAWLFTIMHNLYVNRLRRADSQSTFSSMPEEIESLAAPPAADPMCLPELERACSLLQPDQREILLLVALEGLSYRQVATILGVPEGTVMSRLARARERLRRALEGDADVTLRRIK